VLLLGLGAVPVAAQTVDATTYPFTYAPGAALEDMSSGTTQLLGPDLDDAASSVLPVGFEFWFAGVRYTSFSVNSNGLLKPGTAATAVTPSNSLGSILTAPQIAPYWDDLWIGSNGKVHYKVVGAAPDRKLVVEWLNMQVPRLGAGNPGAATFQCWIHETTGIVEFVYGGGVNTNTTQGGASIGIGSTTGAFASVTAFYPSVDYGTANNANVTPIASGTRYTFTPQVPAAPTNLVISQVGAQTMTLGWTDQATNEVGYAVWRSTDGVNYDFVTQTAANTTSLLQTGLTPSTTYSWLVRAVTEGAVSAALTGSQSTSPTGSIASAGSGNWSSTVPGAPWPGGIVPTASDSVTIADGHTVTVDAPATCYSLRVGQGASGVLQFEATAARTLNVVGSVIVSPGALLASASTGTQTGHTLSLGGDLLNQGTIDLSTSGDLAGASLSFTGGANASLSGSGPLTDVRAITVNKTGGSALTLNSTSFSVRGQTADTLGFLTLTSGTFHLAGSFAMTSPVFTTATYTLAAGTTFWLDNPSFVVLPKPGSATVRGLRISAGLFQVGVFSNNSLQLANGSEVTVEGGQVRVAGRMAASSATNAITYVQSAGTITVNTVGHNSTSQASFDLGTGTSSTTISGGTIVLQRASTAGSGPRDYRNGAAAQNITGGMLQIGSDSTGVASTFFISGTTPPLAVTNLSGGHTARLFGATTVVGSTQIAAGATLDLNGARFTQSSGNLVNNGTLTAAPTNSELYFLGGGTPQSYSGSGTIPAPVASLSVDNPSGFSIDPAVAANVVTRRVNLIRGVLGNSQKLTLGNGNADTLSAVTQVGAVGVTGTAGSYDAAPVFNPGTGGVAVFYLQQATPRTTGFEIPATRQLRDLTLDDPGGVVSIAGGPVTLTRGLTLATGLLHTTASNLVQLGDTSSVIPAGSAQSYVDGPLAIAVRTLDPTPASRAFAVGRDGAFRSVTLSGVLTGGLSQVLTAEVLAGPTGGTPTAPLQSLATTRYWRLGNSAGLNTSARVRLDFGTDDLVGDLGSVHVAQSSAANGGYADLGGTPTGTQSSGTVTSTADLVPGSDYFVVASAGALASSWDGGAGTPNWGDGANWNPDGVPDSTRDVTLSLTSPSTLHLAGDFTVRSLTVNGSTTLQLDSGTLRVKQDFTQSGGVVRLAGGAFVVGHFSSLLGGTLDVGAGTYRASDFLWVPGGTLHVSSGAVTSDSTLAIEGGTVSVETGVLEIKGSFWRTSGNFFSGTSTTIFSGTQTQFIGGAVTYYNLILRNGGTGQPKQLQSFLQHTVNNDLTVESTAQMDLSGATPTQLTVWGNLYYSGLAGGSAIGNLTVQLSGVGKTLSGVPTGAPALVAGTVEASAQVDAPVEEVDFRTDPMLAQHLAEERDGKPLLALENTYEKRKGDVEQRLRTADPAKRLVINLDDMTLVKNPAPKPSLALAAISGASLGAVPTSTLPMAITVATSAAYALNGNLSLATNKVLSISGRLDCGSFTVGGAGKVTVALLGILGTATTSASGLAATVTTTGVNAYNDGAIVEYNAAADQTINAGNHPAAAMIRTAGSGTKTLSANKTISATSGANLAYGALYVGAGTTFADAGFRLSLTTGQIANVIVLGTYQSTGAGSISYESGAFSSNIQAANGTAFGDLLMNFNTSTLSVDLNAVGTSNISFRNLTFGGTAGTANNGGTLRLSETGTTNVTVTGNVSIAPRTVTATGGGFGGTSGRPGQVSLLGNLTSTSTAATQPILNGTGTNKLVFAGASRQTFSVAATTTMFTGSTLQLANPAGVQLGGSGLTYTIGSGGAVDLGSGNINTGTNTLALAAGSPLTRTTGRVVGRLKKGLATGPGTAAFEIGTETADTPVSLAFGNVSVGGNISALTTAGDHPNLATSNLDATKTVNRYYNVTNEGVAFDTCTVGLTFPATDVDAGANTAAFAVRKFNSPTWSPAIVAQRTATSIQAKRITSFSDFAIGEATSFYLTASAGSQGSISPSGQLIVAPGASQTYTMTPAAFSHVVDVAVDGASVGPVTSYAFTGVAADHSIDASFALNTYTIAASAGAHGTISPSGAVSVTHGTNQTFTITPDTGYNILDVQVDGVSVGAVASYTFSNVTAAHTIAASFAIRVYAIAASAATHGTISPTGTVSVSHGASQTFAVAPDSGYHVLDVAVDGVSAGAVTSYTFSNVTAAHTIAASFAINVYTITASAGGGGSISPAGAVPVTHGTSQTFTIAADPGHVILDVLVDGVSVGAVTTYTFSSVTAPHTISASFSTVYTITASAGSNGTISPSGAVSVTQGASQLFTMVPSSGYVLLDVLVDGVTVGPVTSYTFTNVAASHTISAAFTAGATISLGTASSTISTATPCVTLPVTLSRTTSEPVRGFSVSFTLSPAIELCSGTSSVSEGTFLSSMGTTFFQTVDRGGGHYTTDGAILGSGCGPTGPGGTLFQIAVKSALPSGAGTVTLDSLRLRDCDNNGLFVVAGPADTVAIDNTPPSVSVTAPNGGEVWTIGTTHAITWTASDNAAVDSVSIAYSTDGGATYPRAIAANLANTGTYAWVVPDTRSTTARVRVIAHDHAGNAASDASDAGFEIREVNVAPVLAAIGNKSVAEGSTLTFTASATDANLPAQSLTFSLDPGAPTGASINTTTGVFTWTPTEAQGPSDSLVTVRVKDDGTPQLGASETITIHVTEVNQAPVLAGVPASASIAELAAYTFTATATDGDLPAQPMTFSLAGTVPAGASINATTGAFTWTPSEAQGPGSYPFSVQVSDGVATTAAAITLTVTEVNAAPVLAGVPASATIPELAAYTFTATATDSDVPAQTLTFSLVNAPDGASINATTGAFTWTPTEAQGPGSFAFSVRVNDGTANTDAAITIAVSEGNSAPVLAGVPASATIPELVAYTFTATATDADLPAQTLTFSLVGAPTGAGIDATTGAFSWTPTEAQGPGSYSFTVQVSDGSLTSSSPIALTVSEVNATPVVSGVPASVTIPELVAYSFTASATDSDVPAQTVTFSLVSAPPGASIDASTGVFGWTPTEAQGPGVYAFSVHASDGVGATDAPISITVSEVTVPVISDLTATRLDTGNDRDGTVKIRLSWTATAGGTTVEVYRAPFGGYPLYDDAGGAAPAVPSYPPGAPWTLISATTPGVTDEPASRDQYFYVAFVKGAGLNVSAASNRTDGTLDYQLGDFTNGLVADAGDNLVSTADLSVLGSHYGLSGAAVAPFAYLDVGPTSDGWITGRPLTDHAIGFEDLVLVGINFHVVSAPQASARPASRPAGGTPDELTVDAPAWASATGTQLTARLLLKGSGGLQGLSTTLDWDPNVVRPLSAAAGALLAAGNGVVFSPSPGTADAVLLGAREIGLAGEGAVAEVVFEVLRPGEPRIAIASIVGRDAANRPVPVTRGLGSTHVVPQTTALAMSGPNPFHAGTAVALSLAHASRVEVELFSVDGRRVRRLMDGVQEPGVLRIQWDGRDDGGRGAGAGVYFLRVEADRQRFTKRLVLLP
jgi:hypothetical protein